MLDIFGVLSVLFASTSAFSVVASIPTSGRPTTELPASANDSEKSPSTSGMRLLACIVRVVPSSIPTSPCRSEEHTSELQSLMRISYAVFCLQKKNNITTEKQKTDIAQT